MKISRFDNNTVFWSIIALLGVLLLWNLYTTIASGNLIGLLPITIQAIVIVLVLTKNQYAKIVIKIWLIIFIILGPSLQFIGQFLQDIANSFTNADILYYLDKAIRILIGVTLLIYVNRTVEVVEK